MLFMAFWMSPRYLCLFCAIFPVVFWFPVVYTTGRSLDCVLLFHLQDKTFLLCHLWYQTFFGTWSSYFLLELHHPPNVKYIFLNVLSNKFSNVNILQKAETINLLNDTSYYLQFEYNFIVTILGMCPTHPCNIQIMII